MITVTAEPIWSGGAEPGGLGAVHQPLRRGPNGGGPDRQLELNVADVVELRAGVRDGGPKQVDAIVAGRCIGAPWCGWHCEAPTGPCNRSGPRMGTALGAERRGRGTDNLENLRIRQTRAAAIGTTAMVVVAATTTGMDLKVVMM